jgi:hypothetical protein
MTDKNFNIEFQPIPNHPNFINLTGQKFNRLEIIGYAGRPKSRTLWFCRCDCGKIVKVAGDNLKNANSKSCGCYDIELKKSRHTHRESLSITGKASPEYTAYNLAKGRCNNPNLSNYHLYGGSGIKFRFSSFEEFLEEVGRKPSPKHSLDRKNNNGHYERGNVRWATPKEQSRNKHNTPNITIKGVTKHLKDWTANITHYNRALSRTHKGWCVECAIYLPVGEKCQHINK